MQGTTRPDSAGSVVGHAFAERCGSRRKKLIPNVGAIPINSGIWLSNSQVLISGGDYDRALSGYDLPSLRPITIPVPGANQALVAPFSTALSSRNVYLVDSADQ